MTDVVMPKMGESITEGTILEWKKQVGDSIEKDETLLEISTDKVDSEIPSPATGTIVEIIAQVNDTIPVGDVIARIGEVGESTSTEKASVETGPTGGANYAVEYAHKLSKTVIAIKPKSENTEFNDGFKKLVANGAIEADTVSQAIKIIKKGIKPHKTSLDDFK